MLLFHVGKKKAFIIGIKTISASDYIVPLYNSGDNLDLHKLYLSTDEQMLDTCGYICQGEVGPLPRWMPCTLINLCNSRRSWFVSEWFVLWSRKTIATLNQKISHSKNGCSHGGRV